MIHRRLGIRRNQYLMWAAVAGQPRGRLEIAIFARNGVYAALEFVNGIRMASSALCGSNIRRPLHFVGRTVATDARISTERSMSALGYLTCGFIMARGTSHARHRLRVGVLLHAFVASGAA